MHELIMIFSLLTSMVSTNYVAIENIEYYQTTDDIKKLIFNFNSDYFNEHELKVEINFFEMDNTFISKFSNYIKIVGKKKSIANINYQNNNSSYALIDVFYQDKTIVKSAKINFYTQDNCYINVNYKNCNAIYLSKYEKGTTIDKTLNLAILDNPFNKFLNFNSLDFNNVVFNSDYNFENANIYFVIKDKIEGYGIYYDEEYKLLLNIKEEKNYFNLELIDNYFVGLNPFRYEESYFDNSIKTKQLFFPYNEDYKEYECLIVIEDFITIEILFNVATSELLFGDCSNSKYCLKRNSV